MISRVQKNVALLFRTAVDRIEILNTFFFLLVDLWSKNQSEKTLTCLRTAFPARVDVDGLVFELPSFPWKTDILPFLNTLTFLVGSSLWYMM